MRPPRLFSIPTGALRAVVVVAVVAGTIASVSLRAEADPSFGLSGNGRSADIFEPALGAASVPPPSTPLGAPVSVLSPAALGLPSGVTSDDISFGNDNSGSGTYVVFSVDDTSVGYPLARNDVYAEAAGADAAAAADVFVSSSPWSANCAAAPNQQIIDGDGLLGGGLPRNDVPGLGLDESPPGPPGTAARDELSSLEMSGNDFVDPSGDGVLDQPVFFTLASIDAPLLGFANASGGDIYMKPASGGNVLRFATAAQLGLAAAEDIDALAVYRPGAGTQFNPATDTAVFSLKRGSISLPTTCGVAAGAGTAADLWVSGSGGLVPYLFAERMGLCAKRAYGLCNPYATDGNDNIDAIDLVEASGVDLDEDGIVDAIDPDDDGDSVWDGVDNCPTAANGDQLNSDSGPSPPKGFLGDVGGWSNGPDAPGDDATVANGDHIGDVCDPDNDNDGRLDADELAGAGCGGVLTAVSTDNIYGGITSPPPGGTSWDADGDTVPDGVECALGTNPTVGAAADRAACSASLTNPNGDDDADGLFNVWEKCKWGTNPALDFTNTDGDALGDCKEVMDVNGNGIVNASDGILVLQAVLGTSIGDLAAMDINANGIVTASDRTVILQKVFGAPCL